MTLKWKDSLRPNDCSKWALRGALSIVLAAFLAFTACIPTLAAEQPDDSIEEEVPVEGTANEMSLASTKVTVSEAMSWCESKLGKKVGTGQCVALIQAYYTYLGVSTVSGNACDYATNSLPSGWSRKKGGTPAKGDILVYTGAKYGHVAIYAGGTTSYHQNMSGKYVEKKTNWNYDKSWYSNAEGGTKSYWGYIRPNWPTAPGKPAITSVNANSSSAITIKWGAVSGATSYEIRRKKAGDGEGWEYYKKVGTSTSTSYKDTGLEAGTRYAYGIVAINSAGNSGNPGADNRKGTYTLTEKPKVTSVTPLSSSQLKVKWDAVAGAAGYEVYRRKTGEWVSWEETYEKIGSATGTEYTDSGLAANTTYHYGIVAINGAGEGSGNPGADNRNNGTTLVTGSEMSSGYDRVLPDGDYMIVSAADPRYFLDIAGGDAAAANGANVQIYGPSTGNPAAPDVWTITYSDGFYTIRQKDSTAALDVTGGNRDIGANVGVWQKNNNSSQKWAVSVINWSEKGYRIQSKCSGMSLDIAGGTIASGTNIRQYTGNTSNAQRWLFIPYEPGRPVADGRYMLISGMDAHVEMDVPGNTGDIADGTSLQIWDDGTDNRYNSFDVRYAGDGYYNLVHAASGKYMGVKGAATENYADIQLSAPDGSNSQKWCMIAQNGGYMLVNRHSGLTVDVESGKTENATNVRQHFYNGSNAQTWKFVKAEHTVSYDANGGTGEPSAQTKYYANALMLSATVPEAGIRTFKGWATRKDAAEAQYQPGASYTADADVVLYAVWEELEADFVLPEALREIEEEAFEGGAFHCVRIGENVESIGSRAFADCGSLEYVIIPERTTYIAPDAFEGTSGLTIIGESGSYADQYAQAYGFSFKENAG